MEGDCNVSALFAANALIIRTVYTTKITDSCLSVCPAMRFVVLRGMELKLGMELGDGSPRLIGTYFQSDHIQGKVKGQPEVNLP